MKLSDFIKIWENIVIFFQFALQEVCISQIGKKKNRGKNKEYRIACINLEVIKNIEKSILKDEVLNFLPF